MEYHLIALLSFALTFTLHAVSVRRKTYLSRKITLPLLMVGFVSITLFLVEKGRTIHACPIGNPFEIVTMIVWSSIFFYLLISLLFKVNYLGFFTAGLGSIIVCGILLIPGLNYQYSPESIHSSHIVGFHASLAVFSYGIFAIQALTSVMYLVQYSGLAKRRVGNFFSILPPLVKLEKLEVGIMVFGVFSLSVALFVGSFSIVYGEGSIPVYKLSVTTLVWVVYGVLLVLYLLKRLVSSRFAWFSLFAFGFALAALIPVDKARHEPEPNRSVRMESQD